MDAIETKYAQRGKTVEITGLNDPSADLHGKLTGELTGGVLSRTCSALSGPQGWSV